MKRAALLLAVLAILAVLAYKYRAQLAKAVREFFLSEGSPLNLAIFRVVLFIVLFVTADREVLLNYAGLPTTLLYPPALADLFPWSLSPEIAERMLLIFKIACFCGLIGLFTRTAALVTVLSGIYVLGVPQLFGKVNHCHHLLWFALLIAVGPPSMMLSIDGIWQAWKRADQKDISEPQPHNAHLLPIRLAMVLMGLMYFWPGIWKFMSGGVEWMMGDNIRNLMYADWRLMGKWLPPVRLDGNTLLLTLGGIGTVCFEIFFFVLVFFRRTRLITGIGGILFHNMTYINMGIRFGTLQAMYVALVDWKSFLAWVEGKLWSKPFYLVYDGDCRFCRRALASIRTLDILSALKATDGQSVDVLPNGMEIPFTRQERLDNIIAYDGKWRVGVDAYAHLFLRTPIFWFMVPFLWLPGLYHLCKKLYTLIAENRHLLIGEKKPRKLPEFKTLPVWLVGGMLISAAMVYGALDMHKTWPLGSYPTYEYRAGTSVETLAYSENGQVVEPILDTEFAHRMMPNRLNGLLQSIRNDKNEEHQKQALRDLYRVWKGNLGDKPWNGENDVKALVIRVETNPEKWEQPGVVQKVIEL